MSRRFRLRALATLAVTAASLVAFARPAAAAGEEGYFVDQINSIRVNRGLAPLAVDGQLTAVARSWSQHMASDGTLEHNPNLSGQVSGWKTLGENVGTGPSVESIEAAFENSPHHFQNMVDSRFNYIGVGVVQDSGGTYWVTEDFKQSTNAPAPAPSRPAAPAAPKPVSHAAPKPASAPRPVAAPVHAAARPAQPRPTAPAVPVATTAVPVPPPTVPLAVLGTNTKRVPAGSGALISNPFTRAHVVGLVAFVLLGLAMALFTRVRLTRAASPAAG